MENKETSLKDLDESLNRIGVKRLAIVIANISAKKSDKGVQVNQPTVRLKETRRLFTLLQPLTEKQNLMTQIVKFQIEKDAYSQVLEDELGKVTRDCRVIIKKATQLMEQIEASASEEDADWQDILNNDQDELRNQLLSAQKVLTSISHRVLESNNSIGVTLKKKRSPLLSNQHKFSNKTYVRPKKSDDLFSGPEFEKLLDMMRKSNRKDASTIASVLSQLRRQGHGQYAKELFIYFDRNYYQILNYLQGRL